MTFEIRYSLMDPSGNVTILADTAVPDEQQAVVGARLMSLEPVAEQAGFLSDSGSCDLSLRMAGGEFCGNAAMSAAVLHGIRNGMSQGTVLVEVSGEPDPVPVQIRSGNDPGEWQGIVKMPRPRAIGTVCFSNGSLLPVVAFRGISHVILEHSLPEKEAERLVRQWCAELKADALGMMFLDRETVSMKPLVFVPAADTLFWESTCGSGAAAVGAWLSSESGKEVSVPLNQPGGVLEITASPDGFLFLKGTVKCIYEKTAVIHL